MLCRRGQDRLLLIYCSDRKRSCQKRGLREEHHPESGMIVYLVCPQVNPSNNIHIYYINVVAFLGRLGLGSYNLHDAAGARYNCNMDPPKT